MKSESQVLSEVFDNTRNLTRFYSSLLKGQDEFYEFQLNDKTLNSIYWLLAHITWAEKSLLLDGLEMDYDFDFSWLNKFRLGSGMPEDKSSLPSLKEVLEAMKQIHKVAMDTLQSFDDSELDIDNPLGFGFAGDKSKRMLIHHVIRHEAQHVGHLSWICKLNGVKTP